MCYILNIDLNFILINFNRMYNLPLLTFINKYNKILKFNFSKKHKINDE